MAIYQPSDILNFGKYKGEKLDFVFTFHPEYIEWLIMETDTFSINIDAFKKLHTCPFAQNYTSDSKYYNYITAYTDGKEKICTLREYLTDFMDLYENHYLKKTNQKNYHTFAEKVIKKNKKNIERIVRKNDY